MQNNSNISNSNNNNSNNNNSNIDNNQLLYPSEAGRLLKVSLQTLRRWHKDGALSAVVTPGHQMRIPKSEVDRILGRYAQVDRPIPPEAYKGFAADDTEPEPMTADTILLAKLFKESDDPIEAQIAKDIRLGHIPMHTNTSSSFTI